MFLKPAKFSSQIILKFKKFTVMNLFETFLERFFLHGLFIIYMQNLLIKNSVANK